jgi:hypothetical protein
MDFPKRDDLKTFSVAGINDFINKATDELGSLTASATPETVTDEQLARMEQLNEFLTASAAELTERSEKAARFTAASVIPAPAVTEVPAVVASTEVADPAIDVASTTPTPVVAGQESAVVAASVTPADQVTPRTPTLAEIAATSPNAEIPNGSTQGFSIVASADTSIAPQGSVIDYSQFAAIFEEKAAPHQGMARTGGKYRSRTPLGLIRRDFDESQVLLASDTDQGKYNKLMDLGNSENKEILNREAGNAITAAVGWCAPSETDYSICSPITTDGLLRLPEVAVRRGGLRHTQGLDFASFFGNDFVLPITGYNILTEAQVISDTAKTCVEIPCPPFVDDRLNVAALCLTGSLLQNRGYPEFVATFVQGAIAAMAHLVNREVLNEIVAGSTVVFLGTVDPWVSDGSVLSQFMSAVEMAVMDMRYSLRTSQTQMFTGFLPLWFRAQLRADYIRQNARVNEDLADSMIDAMLRTRGYAPQWVYGYMDAFNPADIVATTGVAGVVPAANQAGNATPILSLPFLINFTMFLPGTWVLGRADVIRLELVYDSTNLAQNQVTQLFAEDGFKPMRMCVGSRVYTVNICPNGSTGVQRAVTCTDVTP